MGNWIQKLFWRLLKTSNGILKLRILMKLQVSKPNFEIKAPSLQIQDSETLASDFQNSGLKNQGSEVLES